MFSFNSIGVLGGFFFFNSIQENRKMGNEWEMGNVLESGIHIY